VLAIDLRRPNADNELAVAPAVDPADRSRIPAPTARRFQLGEDR
jgi:hypothetical protein